ncbi:MAG TPA: hypothetical protein VH475_03910 [Tepidisphaeraceae bacterium]|jgi:flagellar export protein FliJ
MLSRKFQFRIQPALDKAIAKQKACEDALVQARKSLEAEQQKLQRLIDELENIRQQIRAGHDNLVSPGRSTSDPKELFRASQFLTVLKHKEDAQKLRIEAQRKEVAWANEKLELRKKELNEATAQVRALEKLKEKRKKEHELAVQKAEESRRDDDAIQLWNSRRNE